MMEVLSESIWLVNLPFTILLGCVVLYWLMMCLGLVDFDTGADVAMDASVDMDVDADVAVDADADVDMDSDAEVNSEIHAGWFSPFLQFLNIGEVLLTLP